MHTLIVGNSCTGKSNLAKSIARDTQNTVIVYDPLSSDGWPDKAVKFSSASKFFNYLDSAQNAFVFVDEGKTLWDENPKEADKLLYRRRHQGLLVFAIAQRTRMIPPNARNQCSKVFAFKQQKDDAMTLGEEYDPALYDCMRLPKAECIASDGFTVKHYTLDYSVYPPNIVES